MNKRSLKIMRLYMIGFFCVACYFFLENSNIIPDLVEYSNKGRYNGFITFFFTGLFKYGLLVVGICIISILSFLLIKERISKDN